MRYPIAIVDAFTERPFAGNPAGVMILESPFNERMMQAIAAEMNQAETAFAVRRDGAWDLRWFTPTQEVAFCGHATLATAHLLAEQQGISGEIMFHTRQVGVLRVRVEGEGRYRLDVPRHNPEACDLSGVRSIAPGAIDAFQSHGTIFAVLGAAQDVIDFQPDLPSIAAKGGMGLCVTAKGGRADFTSRFFGPAVGIPEDPVTGSIHATLVPYWAGHLERAQLVAAQASRRGGRLDCELGETRVFLTGSAVTTLRGHIDLPD